ncbi:hypothetical protein JCM8097_003323 [Rhodosporidiobolus ruineniae]
MAPPQPGSASTADIGTSVRSRSKQSGEQPRKTVFRPVLDNNLTVQWPPLPAPTRKAILDELLALVAASTDEEGRSVADWRWEERSKQRGKGKNAAKGKGKEKAVEGGEDAPYITEETDVGSTSSRPTHSLTTRSSQTYTIPTSLGPPSSSNTAPTPVPLPELLSHLVVGINEVTRALESRVRWGRWKLGDPAAAPFPSASISAVPGEKEKKGRYRRRKSSSTSVPAVLPPASSALKPALDLSALPAYSFAHDAPPPPSRDALPPYLVASFSRVGAGGVRMLVNSEARRLKPAPRKKEEKEEKKTGGKKAEKAEAPAAHPALGTPADVLLPTSTSQPAATLDSPSTPSSAVPASLEPPTLPLIDLIFVCKPDINPPALVAHLPTMVAAANGVQEALDSVLASHEAEKGGGEGMKLDEPEEGRAKRPQMGKVLLVPLDVGAEAKLADALGLRRVAAIGLSSSAPGTATLLSLLCRSLPSPLQAPWLVPHLLHPLPPSSAPPAAPSSTYVPTQIKHLRTSAPLNPKAANVEKKRARREKKDEAKREAKRRKLGDGVEATAKADEAGGVYVAED